MAALYKINYKSDFVLTINSDAGWAVPFCIKFWTGMPSQAYFAGFDGEDYVNCRVGDTPTQLLVMFDDHHMPIGELKMQIAYHTTIEEFPDRKFDEVTNPTNVTVDIDGTEYQVMLDFTGETGAEIDFSMPSSGVMSVNGKIGYVTLNAEDVGAQPTIEDLATIRSGAAEGATAVQPDEMTAALATKQDTISDLATIRSGAAKGATAVQPAALTPIESALQTIEAVIPSAATAQNQLADKNFVNSSISTNTANFVGTYNSLAELQAVQNPTNNDYGFVIETDAQGNEYYDRYKYVAASQQWLFEYKVESTPFTAAQWAAIQSGITSALVTKLNALPTNAELQQTLDGKADAADIPTALSQLSQDSTHRTVTDAEKSTWNGKQNAISDLSIIRSGAEAGATAVQPAALQEGLAAKQDTLTFDNTPTANSDNPVKSGGIKTALDAKQSTISTVNVTVDNNTGTPSGSASVSGSTLSLSFQNLKGATGATGATGPQGPRGERGLPGESGVTGDVSGFTVIQTIDPSATYGPTDIAGAATVQATNAELTELAGEVDKHEEVLQEFIDETSELHEPVNWLDFNSPDIIEGQYINPSTGAFANNASYEISGYIPVKTGETYGIVLFNVAGTSVASVMRFIYGLNEYDENKTRLRTINNGSGSETYTPSNDAKFFRFATTKANMVSTKTLLYYGTRPSTFSVYFAPYYTYDYEIKDNVIKENNLQDDSVSFEKIAFKQLQVGKNKLNPSEIGTGWIQMTTGNALGGNNYRYTPYIEASMKGLFFNKSYSVESSGIGAAVYDSSKTYKRGFVGGAYVYEDGDAYVRWTMTLSSYNEGELQVEEGNVATAYEPFTEKEVIDPSVLPYSFDAASIAESLKFEKIYNSSIELSLPDRFFAVVGDTLQIFYQGLAKCVDIENYNVLITCSKGKQYHRYFEYTPLSTDVGETTFGITIYDNNRNILGTGSCVLVTLAQPSAPSSVKKFMCVGDSLTANGIWVAEAYRRLTGSGGTPAGLNLSNITFGGSKTKDGAGYIGLSGWSWYNFVSNSRAAFRFTLSGSPSLSMGATYSNNGHNYQIIEIIDNTILCETNSTSNTPSASGTLTKVSGGGDASLTFTSAVADVANPFWDGSKVSFTNYVNTYLGGSVDYVYTLLSWNGMYDKVSTIMESVKTFVDALHRDFPNAKLRLMGLQFPSMKLMMPTYGAKGSDYADTYAMYIKAIELQEAFQEFANSEGYSTWVEHINVAAEFDSEYNMPITQKDVNTRNSSYQEPYANNGVHPANAGYLQIGDVAYRSIVNDLRDN